MSVIEVIFDVALSVLEFFGWMFVSRDDPIAAYKSVAWHQKKAEQGNAKAQFALGWKYEHGIGIPKDVGKAVEWYRLAAEQGDTSAQNALDRLK
jgi:TPR repeat protein